MDFGWFKFDPNFLQLGACLLNSLFFTGFLFGCSFFREGIPGSYLVICSHRSPTRGNSAHIAGAISGLLIGFSVGMEPSAKSDFLLVHLDVSVNSGTLNHPF